MGTMRELLARWAVLEPERCKRETRPNQPWLEEFESFYVLLPLGEDKARFHLVATDSEPRFLLDEALMKIQWAVQSAVVERNLSLDIHYGSSGWDVFIDGHAGFAKGKGSVVEALLEAYIDYLETNS